MTAPGTLSVSRYAKKGGGSMGFAGKLKSGGLSGLVGGAVEAGMGRPAAGPRSGRLP